MLKILTHFWRYHGLHELESIFSMTESDVVEYIALFFSEKLGICKKYISGYLLYLEYMRSV